MPAVRESLRMAASIRACESVRDAGPKGQRQHQAIPKASERPQHQQRVVNSWQDERARLEDWSEEHGDWLAGDVEARNELRV
jgi:hypothetical protein